MQVDALSAALQLTLDAFHVPTDLTRIIAAYTLTNDRSPFVSAAEASDLASLIDGLYIETSAYADAHHCAQALTDMCAFAASRTSNNSFPMRKIPLAVSNLSTILRVAVFGAPKTGTCTYAVTFVMLTVNKSLRVLV